MIVYLFAQVWLLITSLIQVTVAVLQLSLALPPAKSCAGTADAHCTVVGAGQLIVGAVLSTAVMVCVTSIKLPEPSVTRYVLVTIYGLPGHPLPPLFASLIKVTEVKPQLSASSVTTAGFGAGTAPIHCTLTDPGLLAVGFSVSFTVILKVQVPVAQLVVTVTVTVVVPLLNVDPLPVPEPLPVVAPLKVYDTVGGGEDE